MIRTIAVVIACSFVTAILKDNHEVGKEENGDLVLKFNRSIINLFLAFSILSALLLIVILILGFKDGDVNNTLAIFTFFLAAFLFFVIFYLLCKKKKIIISGENIKVYGVRGNIRDYTFADIDRAKDHQGNNIVLYTKNGDKFSVDYQMNNFIQFKAMLVSRNIAIKTRGNKRYKSI